MLKKDALKLLGGTVTSAAKLIGISVSAVSQWPDELPDALSDRVFAALARQQRIWPELTTTKEVK